MKKMAASMKWVSMAAALLLVFSCFLPWAYYPDLDKSFTGFFSQNNVYGKPGKFLVVMAMLSLFAQWMPQVFYKRANLLLMALNMAYAIKSYIIYASCYGVVCPHKLPGIYLMVLSAFLLLFGAFFPVGTVKTPAGALPDSPAAPDDSMQGS